MVAYGVFTLLYSNTELMVKKILIYFVTINFLPTHILDSLKNIRSGYCLSILNEAYS